MRKLVESQTEMSNESILSATSIQGKRGAEVLFRSDTKSEKKKRRSGRNGKQKHRAVSTCRIGRIPISHSMTAAYHPRNPLSADMEGGFNNNPSGWQDSSRVGLTPFCQPVALLPVLTALPPSNNDMSHVTRAR